MQVENLTGSVERITFYNPQNGYSVVRLRPASRLRAPGINREGLVTIVGNLPELSPGEHVRLRGNWINHPKHGQQFQVDICEQTLPATTAGIRRYLGSGLIKGIGPRLAERIVNQFGDQTMKVIEDQPERLREVPDIGIKRSSMIAQAWEDQKHVKEIMIFLHSHGVSTNLAIKIYKQYGDQSLNIVQTDPYRMAADIFGVGFKTADRIAQALGLPTDHPSRMEAGVAFALGEMTDDGHVYAPQRVLVERSKELLDVTEDHILPALERLSQDERIHQERIPLRGETKAASGQRVREDGHDYAQHAVYLTPLYFGETGVAKRLRGLAHALPSRLSDLPPDFIALDPGLSPEQHIAIKTALSHPVSILTGGPGTGKTTCVQALIAVVENAKKSFALASPTGRAAKRLSEATGHPASTIHRLLGFTPGEGFKHNADKPLAIDLLVVDECSMLDLLLANNLLKALQAGTHLVLVGDVDQLPSVGAGDVLRDVIDSDIAPVTRLNVIFRQAAGSQIITNAHRINQGQMPLFQAVARDRDGVVTGDFFLFPAEKAEEAGHWVQAVVCNRIPQHFGLDPMGQIQVLAPMYRGAAGVHALNERLQEALNPASPMKAEKQLYGETFRTGDKVMQIKNNYDKEVFNGDIGVVSGINSVAHTITVEFDGRRVEYDWSEGDQLVLAYAVSVHKSQGSEFPAVVMPILTAHYMMLQRNLLYTAITRAKELCVLVGNRRAIGIAVNNNKVAHRYTALDWRLQEG